MKYIGLIIMIFMLGFYCGFASERERQPSARTIEILYVDGQQLDIEPPILLSEGQEYELKLKELVFPECTESNIDAITSWSDTEIIVTI